MIKYIIMKYTYIKKHIPVALVLNCSTNFININNKNLRLNAIDLNWKLNHTKARSSTPVLGQVNVKNDQVEVFKRGNRGRSQMLHSMLHYVNSSFEFFLLS